ncbi:Hypothetical protein R9X50_00648000 [Acrodontium crateriforme]|uniref:Polyketide synthase n=1 Tax=Acrodontium crateriforme TaxID=150365 RepID=A0AAQ3RDM6_9PEZI|nr:Hypothetical protein R9X50_00648000 [Acrodontium crateriforme]
MAIPSLLYFGNEYPTDDLKELFRRLHNHAKDRRFPALAIFLRNSTIVLKQELPKLPEDVQKLVPHFDSITDLADAGDFRHGPLGAAMESALLTVLEVGHFIGHYESKDLDWELTADHTTLAGLSIGILAGAAVALSDSVVAVAHNGVEAVRVSFRLGVYVHHLSAKIEAAQADGTLSSWAHVVTGLDRETVDEQIDNFNAEIGNPELTKVFISAADSNSISVSGPPSRIIRAFQHSKTLRYSRSLPLPVYDGLCHASHLYSRADIDEVINGKESVIPATRRVRLPLLSSQTGKPFSAATSEELFSQIGAELLTGTIYVDNVSSGILDRLSAAGPDSAINVDSFRTSLVYKGVISAIEAHFPEVELHHHDMLQWVYDDFRSRKPQSTADAKLAIVGLSCRMPGGANDDELFWELLEKGRKTMTTIPVDRFDLATHYDPSGKTENATSTPYGNFIDAPGMFDAGFFNMSPKEAEQTDPMARLALVTAYEAMEMAGLVPGRTLSSRSSRIGTFYGQASDDWRELNASQNIGTYAVPGGERAFANGRINYFFKFSGPSFNVDTACSSGLAAVNLACSALWAGEVDTAIAGGLNIITDPDNYCGLGNAHFLSPTGACKVWDKSADGYCRADGIGSVVIKRLEDAEADNDNILAVVLGAATNHSAEAISITHPHAKSQEQNYGQVLHQAGVNPLDVSYIELHGTGTQAGDAVESESVFNVFAPLSPRRSANQTLHLGAVKSNIGHGEAAAGSASLIKALLAFQKESIPAHVGITTEINPAIPKDLDKRQICLPMVNTPWPRIPGKKRLAVVNSFGAHGGNTTLLLEDGPEKTPEENPIHGGDARPAHPIVLSAKSKKSLKANVEKLLQYLDSNPETDLGDLSYTTCGRRMHFSLRIGTTASSVVALQSYLRSALDGRMLSDIRPIPNEQARVAFAFTGQGAFYRGFARDLYKEYPFFRQEISQLDQIVQRLGHPSMMPALQGTVDEEEITPEIAQLTVVTAQIALARFWISLGIQPSVVTGHSLGEFAAFVVAGVLSTVDALFIVGQRAKLVQELCTSNSHSMVAVRATPDDIRRLVEDDQLEMSCLNTKEDTVIGGPREVMNVAREKLELNGIKCTQLDLPYAFHTAQMDRVLEGLEKIAEVVTYKSPSIPILSPLHGSVIFDGKTINAAYFVQATRSPVRFSDAIEAGVAMDIVDAKTLWIDVGPHPVCASFVRSVIPEARLHSSLRRNEENMITLSKSIVAMYMAGLSPSWPEFFRPRERSYSLLRLPAYAWNNTNYWIPYLGTWTLDKAHLKHGGMNVPGGQLLAPSAVASTLQTSLIHQVTEEFVDEAGAQIRILSDIQHPDFLEAVHGHTMNNCGVATSSIWSDMALAIGEHLYRLLFPKAAAPHMNFGDFEVLHAQVANRSKTHRQPLSVEASLDLTTQTTTLKWYNIDASSGKQEEEAFASGSLSYEDHRAWKTEWSRVAHLVHDRIQSLDRMAAEGKASKCSKPLAYTLFKNVVDYAERYQGMDYVVINELEAYCDVTLVPELHGNWHTPPHWIDSVSHLAGFIMNGSAASNTKDYFYVTPGCESFRLSKPLEGGSKYRSYCRMFPLADEPNMFAGDIYILQDGEIMGMVGQIKFRKVPRLLMDRFFSPGDTHGTKAVAQAPQQVAPQPARKEVTAQPLPKAPRKSASALPTAPTLQEPPQTMIDANSSSSSSGSSSVSEGGYDTPGTATPPPSKEPVAVPTPAEPVSGVEGQCLELIARETGLSMSDLAPDATFTSLGVDSLMSLVLSEKFRAELGVEVKSSLFLECPTIGEMTEWLEKNC